MSGTRNIDDLAVSALAEQQFGPRAQAYLESAVHAEGTDLTVLAALVRRRPGCSVLDIGCGAGHAAYAVAEAGGHVVACDVSASMLSVVAIEAERRGLDIETRRAGAEALPFSPESFDVVVSRFSAHHWVDFVGGIREAARVLKHGGLAGFIDIISPGTGSLDTHLQAVELMRDISHVRDRTLAEWLATASEAGLVTSEVTTTRLRMEFASWIARISTRPELERAIRVVQGEAGPDVRAHFAIEADGSFTIDSATMLFRRP